ncbi:MAG TPA: hypothetical protein VNF73_06395 [Candidatus Saccharimonadales bacterium]|nr:hypothetical protein [Candidatus Saccharimonadales bacterium]
MTKERRAKAHGPGTRSARPSREAGADGTSETSEAAGTSEGSGTSETPESAGAADKAALAEAAEHALAAAESARAATSPEAQPVPDDDRVIVTRPCPEGHPVPITLGAARRHRPVVCPTCGRRLALKETLGQLLKGPERPVDDPARALRNLRRQ